MERLARLIAWWTIALTSAAMRPAWSEEPTAEQVEFFETSVRPLLVEHCYECHGHGEDVESGLRLTSRAAALAGGDSGPAAVIGKSEESLLIEAVRYQGLEMPPQRKLPEEEIKKLQRWVEMGLPWPDNDTPGRRLAERQGRVSHYGRTEGVLVVPTAATHAGAESA
jgi:hypothetical protein